MPQTKSHYMPQTILREFCDKNGHLSLLHTDNQPAEYGRNPKSVFAERGYYSDEVETLLATKCEGPFGNLLKNKILPAKKTVTLTDDEPIIIGIYALVQILRKFHSEDTISKARMSGDPQLNKTLAERLAPIQKSAIEDFFKDILSERISEKTIEKIAQYRLDLTSPQLPAAQALLFTAIMDTACHVFMGHMAIWDTGNSEQRFVLPDCGCAGNFAYKFQGESHLTDAALLFAEMPYLHSPEGWLTIMDAARSTCEYYIFPVAPTRALVFLHPYYKLLAQYQVDKEDLVRTMGCGIPEMVMPPQQFKHKTKHRIVEIPKKDILFNNNLLLNEAHNAIVFQDKQSAAISLMVYDKEDCPEFPNKNHFIL